MVPMVDAPDEFSHYWVVKFLVEHAHLPSRGEVFAGGPSAVYGPLPQLGYLPHILVGKFLPFWDLALTARLGSLFMGLALVITVYFIARELYPANRWTRLALPLVVVLHPQMVLLDAYTNCDSTAAFVSAIILLLSIRMIKNGLALRGCFALGLLSGLAALSKYSALSVIVASGFALIAAGWLNGASLKMIFAGFGVMVSTLALSCLWWFVRELSEYPGDLLGTQTMRQIWAVTYHRPVFYRLNIWHVIKDFAWWRMTYFSYWGMFGYMTKYIWRPFYIIYFLYTLAAIAGGLSQLRQCPKFVRLVLLKFSGNQAQSNEEDLAALKVGAIYLTFFIALAVNLSAMIWSSSLNLGGAQGRYLFACEVPIVALTIGGLQSLSLKHGTGFVNAFVLFNFVVYVWSFVYLFQAYGGFRTKIF